MSLDHARHHSIFRHFVDETSTFTVDVYQPAWDKHFQFFLEVRCCQEQATIETDDISSRHFHLDKQLTALDRNVDFAVAMRVRLSFAVLRAAGMRPA